MKKQSVGNRKQKEDEKECTFTPKIGSKSRKMNSQGPSGLKRHEHLYEKAVEQQKNLEKKRESYVDENCTFKPRMSTGNSKIAKRVAKQIEGVDRYDRLHSESVKIKKKVEELRKKRESSVGTFTPKITSKAKKSGRPSLAARPVGKNHYAEKEKKRQDLKKSREMKNCTFQPRLNKKKNKKVSGSSFMERLARSNEAKAARLKRLQEEKEKRLQSQMGTSRKKKGTSSVDFDRLYHTGNIKDRLERSKKIKEEEYAKLTFKPNVGQRKVKPTSSGASSIHTRLHEAAARRSAQRKAAIQKKLENEKKMISMKFKKKKSASTGGSGVYSRLIQNAKQDKERREMLRQKKIEREIKQCKIVKKNKMTRTNGKPYWERFYERRNETADTTGKKMLTSEEKELQEHCTGKPKLSETTNQMCSSSSGGKKVWQRLLEVDRREIEKKREEEKLAREKSFTGVIKRKKNADAPSVYTRLIQRAEESAKQKKDDKVSGVVRASEFLTRTSKITLNNNKSQQMTKKKNNKNVVIAKPAADVKPPVPPSSEKEEEFQAF